MNVSKKFTKKRSISEIDDNFDLNNNPKVKYSRRDPDLNKFKAIDERTFYHIHSNQPYSTEDIDEDSSDEMEIAKVFQRVRQTELNDFIDVNDGEKQMMNLWNMFLNNQKCLGCKQMPVICRLFIDAHFRDVIEKKLYRNFLLHLCTLCDVDIITQRHFVDIVKHFKRSVSSTVLE